MPESVLPSDEYDKVVTVIVDMSPSFQDLMVENGAAYQFLMNVMNRYFMNEIGSKSQIVIARIAGNEQHVLLWKGTPQQLREKYGSPAAVRKMLYQKWSDGSFVHDAMTQTLEYLLADPKIASKQCKSVLLVLSDMQDNDIRSSDRKDRIVKALTRYGECGGSVGLYYVEPSLIGPWQAALQKTGIKHYVVKGRIEEQPEFPDFD